MRKLNLLSILSQQPQNHTCPPDVSLVSNLERKGWSKEHLNLSPLKSIKDLPMHEWTPVPTRPYEDTWGGLCQNLSLLTNNAYSIAPDDWQSESTKNEEQIKAAYQKRVNAVITLLTPMSKPTESTPNNTLHICPLMGIDPMSKWPKDKAAKVWPSLAEEM